MIRVGRCEYKGGKRIDPSYNGFTPIVILMKSHSRWYPLSPYELKDEEGHVMENSWQFQKAFETIPATIQYKSQWDKTVIWKHGNECHIDKDGNLTPEYWAWRKKGFENPYPVRYPVGYKYRHNCKFSVGEDGTLV